MSKQQKPNKVGWWRFWLPNKRRPDMAFVSVAHDGMTFYVHTHRSTRNAATHPARRWEFVDNKRRGVACLECEQKRLRRPRYNRCRSCCDSLEACPDYVKGLGANTGMGDFAMKVRR